MRGIAQPGGRPLGGSELWSYFSPFAGQSTSTLNYVCLCGSVRSLQRRFPIDDVLLHSCDIPDEIAKMIRNRAEILMFSDRQISGATQISDRIL